MLECEETDVSVFVMTPPFVKEDKDSWKAGWLWSSTTAFERVV